jgi:hypothetical protein
MQPMHILFVVTTLLAAPADYVRAQPPATPPVVSPAPTAPAAPVAADVFTYAADGRRDPFVSLMTRVGTTVMRPSQEIDSIAGLAVDDLSVRGIVSTPKGFVAMVQGPDGKTRLVRPNDKLFDGTVKQITGTAVVILQDVNDPLSLTKQKEVRKMLRALEEGK